MTYPKNIRKPSKTVQYINPSQDVDCTFLRVFMAVEAQMLLLTTLIKTIWI
jgi:hypothetical protein